MVSNLPNTENNLLLQIALSHLGAAVATVKDTAALEKLRARGFPVTGVLTPGGEALRGWGGWAVEPVTVEEDGGPLWDGMLAGAPTSVPAADDESSLAAVFQGAELRAAEVVDLGEVTAAALDVQPADKMVVSVTLFHSFGIGMGVAGAMSRVSLSLPPPLSLSRALSRSLARSRARALSVLLSLSLSFSLSLSLSLSISLSLSLARCPCLSALPAAVPGSVSL